MPRRIDFGFAALCVAGLLLTGCGSPAHVKTPAPAAAAVGTKAPADADDTDYSPGAVERRTEAHARYTAALLHDWDEQPELAAAEYLKAALADVGNEPLVLEVSQRLLQIKHNEEALKLLIKATAQPGASGVLFARLGLLYSLLNKKDEAIKANRTAIKKMPGSIVGYRHLAQIYYQDGAYEEGLKVLDQAAKQSNVEAPFLIELAELYTSLSRSVRPMSTKKRAPEGQVGVRNTPFGEAHPASAEDPNKRSLELLNRAAKLKPTNPLLLQKLAEGFAQAGEFETAAELYSKLLERFPNMPGLREKLAGLYLRKQDRKHAAEQLQEIIRNNPASPQAYYALGGIFYEDKNLTNAVEMFNKALLLDPAFEQAYYDLALALISSNKPQDAMATLDKAHRQFPDNFVSEFFTGLAYSRMKEFTNAVKHFETAEIIARATDTNRLTSSFYFHLGSSYERIQKYDVAETYFKKCLALSPDFAEALNYLGYMWADRGVNLAQARQMIEKAVKQEPKNAAFLDSLAWVLFKLEKPKEGLPFILKALENSEEPDATLYDHLGDIYSSLHEAEKAREAWEKALRLEPNDQIQKKIAHPAASGDNS